MAEKKITLTEGDKVKLEAELDDLILVKRKENTAKIKEAKEQGDLSENAEYEAARDEQAKQEARILEIQGILANAEIITESKPNARKIGIGSKVTLHDEDFDEDVVYTLVSSIAASSLDGDISIESPVGSALVGHKKGDEVKVVLPNGKTIAFSVLKVEKADK